MNRYQSDGPIAPASPGNSKEYYQRTESAVKIPVFQTLATGVITFAVIGLLGLVWHWTYTLQIAATAACIVIPVYWSLSIGLWRSDSRPEKPVFLAPEEQGGMRKLVHVRHDRVRENGHFRQDEYDLPGDPEALRALARGVLHGKRPFTEGVWAGKNRPFSVPEFRLLRQLGIKKYGLFEYINPKAKNQGVQLTEKGEQLFAELADGDMDEFDEE